MRSVILGLLFVLFPTLSHAYIGPGLGAGTIAVVIGFVAAIGLAMFAIIWYPIKRFIKNRKPRAKKPDSPDKLPV